ncbi:c-type cytochrome [Bordetella avium]|uniref:c-type cytochrome n=1 Tax=Bordetella avium TaxID=521 RepID=UPI000E69FF22|nr:cytochrome c [Bordetella avium]RIQ57475.1 alcohol dehydrogenase [Bordetella avium]
MKKTSRKTKILWGSAIIALGIAAAVGGAHLITALRGDAVDAKPETDAGMLARGAYIARSADCVACHSTPGGAPFAGGLAMQTPVGAIYSTNITPDPDTGIGQYSYADFVRAVQHGVRKDGTPLYPAMPYPSYVIMPQADMQALYAWFMAEVQPVSQANAKADIPWPLNMRWPMAWWQLLFAPERSFTAPEATDARIARGAYLVEGPGHCGACHTPRGLAYQEKAMSLADGDSFLSGAVIDGWRAKSLRGEAQGLQSWDEPEIVDFLRTGRIAKVAAFGAMADVVEHSTRYFTDDDLQSIAAYLKQLPPTPGKLREFAPKADTTTAKLLEGRYDTRGAQLYMEYCVTCHRADGQGVPRIFPALAGNSAVFAQYPQSVIQITLEGGHMPANEVDRMAFAMPAFRSLSDEDIASVISFIRAGWTNQAPAVSAADVAQIRDFVANKSPNAGERHE